MPTRISAGVGDHHCFLITMIPMDCKISNFSSCLYAYILSVCVCTCVHTQVCRTHECISLLTSAMISYHIVTSSVMLVFSCNTLKVYHLVQPE